MQKESLKCQCIIGSQEKLTNTNTQAPNAGKTKKKKRKSKSSPCGKAGNEKAIERQTDA